MTTDAELNPEELRQKLNLETGKLEWEELQPHFARGAVVVAAAGLDLVEVAMAFARDDRTTIDKLLDSQQLHTATDDEARDWNTTNCRFWAVVVAPWVIVQEMTEN